MQIKKVMNNLKFLNLSNTANKVKKQFKKSKFMWDATSTT